MFNSSRHIEWLHVPDQLRWIHANLAVTIRSRDLRSTVDHDLMRLSHTCFDAYYWKEVNGIVNFVLARLVQKFLAKKLPCPQVPLIWLLWHLWRFVWPGLKMTSGKIVHLICAYLMPFIACLAWFVFENFSGLGADIRLPRRYEVVQSAIWIELLSTVLLLSITLANAEYST